MKTNVIHVDFSNHVRVRVCRTEVDRLAAAYSLYERGCAIDADPAKYHEAERLYRGALVLDPELNLARTNLGNVLYRQERLVEARECYAHVIRHAPDQVEAQFNMGYLDLEAGEMRRAVDRFVIAIRLDPSFADAHFCLGEALEALTLHDGARREWAAYLKLEPNGPWSEEARARLGMRLLPGDE